MICISEGLRNRIGFLILGITNSFASIVILSAAYDLLNESTPDLPILTELLPQFNSTNQEKNVEAKCLDVSTATVLLAVTFPGILMKIFYSMVLVGVNTTYKTLITAALSALSLILTGLYKSQSMVFLGAICSALNAGLGEPTFLAITSSYGNLGMSNWSMGTGVAMFVGSITYAGLKVYMNTFQIMMSLLVFPAAMLLAYFVIITKPVNRDWPDSIDDLALNQNQEEQQLRRDNKDYGLNKYYPDIDRFNEQPPELNTMMSRIRHFASLLKYITPVFIVFIAEYFMNGGLFEFVYYPEKTKFDQGAQYRWFQAAFRTGNMIARCTLGCFHFTSLWTLAVLQSLNAALLLAHVTKLIYLPSFELVFLLIIYEGLIGGFTYANGFERVKRETPSNRHDLNFSLIAIAEGLGATMAAIVALPVHGPLCKLYE